MDSILTYEDITDTDLFYSLIYLVLVKHPVVNETVEKLLQKIDQTTLNAMFVSAVTDDEADILNDSSLFGDDMSNGEKNLEIINGFKMVSKS